MNGAGQPAPERAYILGAGPFAGELEAYLLRVYPSALIVKVSNAGEEGAVSTAQYQEDVAHHEGHTVTYIGSGKTFIRERMAREVEGRLGPPVLLSEAIWAGAIGDGTVVAPCAVLAPECRLGESVLINYGASVGHDTTLGDLSVVGPQSALGGNCVIEDLVYIGAGALIRENIHIGRGTTIGMGAIVTKDVDAGCLVTGVNQVRPQPKSRQW